MKLVELGKRMGRRLIRPIPGTPKFDQSIMRLLGIPFMLLVGLCLAAIYSDSLILRVVTGFVVTLTFVGLALLIRQWRAKGCALVAQRREGMRS